MEKVDVLTVIVDSFELAAAHWREVAVPLALILIPSVAMGIVISFFNIFGTLSDLQSPGLSSDSLAAGAMSGGSALTDAFASLGIGVVIFAISTFIAYAILSSAVHFYIYEHFYSLITKKQIRQGWQERMIKYIKKTVVITVATLGVCAAFMILLGIVVLSFSFIGLVGAIIAAVLLLIASVALMVLFMMASPMWIFYVMENDGFFASISKSISMVKKNFWTFLAFFVVMEVISIVVSIGAVLTCCLTYVISPFLQTAVGLVSAIGLMKLRLLLGEKPPQPIAA